MQQKLRSHSVERDSVHKLNKLRIKKMNYVNTTSHNTVAKGYNHQHSQKLEIRVIVSSSHLISKLSEWRKSVWNGENITSITTPNQQKLESMGNRERGQTKAREQGKRGEHYRIHQLITVPSSSSQAHRAPPSWCLQPVCDRRHYRNPGNYRTLQNGRIDIWK